MTAEPEIRLVPVEPTEAMIRASVEDTHRMEADETPVSYEEAARSNYRAMERAA